MYKKARNDHQRSCFEWTAVRNMDNKNSTHKVENSTRSILVVKTVQGSLQRCHDDNDKVHTSWKQRTPRTTASNRSSTSSDATVGSVRFDTITIKEYKPTCGDNPAVSEGPPIQLDWENSEPYYRTVDEYEEERQEERRVPSQLRIPVYVRKEILVYFGHSQEEIKRCTKKAEVIRKRRRHTHAAYESCPQLEENLERITKVFSNLLRRK